MTNQFAEINSVNTHHDDQGKGQALVFIHTRIANLNMWDEHVLIFPAWKGRINSTRLC